MSNTLEQERPILIIDDNPDDRKAYKRYLKKYKHEFPLVLERNDGLNIQAIIEQFNPCCCILDYQLPGENGLQVLKNIRHDYAAERLPVIVLTGEGDQDTAIEMLQNGAQDYLVKSDVDATRLYGAIRSALQTANLQKQLTHLAHYDALTGLLNRSLLINRLGQAIHRCNRYNQKCAILHIDINKFKPLNDRYGQKHGDAVLKEVAARIRKNCRATDSPARLGADEFAILLEQLETDMCNSIAQKLIEAIEQPILVEGKNQTIKISIGISIFPNTASSGDDLLKQADEALQRAKRSDGLSFVSFSEKYKREWTRQQVLERDLPKAIANGDLALVFQPIVSAQGYDLRRLEVLSRWPRKDYEVYALELIEMIDRLGLADPFHDWLFFEAFSQAKKLADGNIGADLCLNIPANYCYSKSITRSVEDSIAQHQVDPTRVELEITESTLMLYPERSVALLNRLHDKGLRIAVDDFGTGYSSMAYLTKLPLDTLKIDKHFFLDNARDSRNKKVISAVTALGHSLGLDIIAEGVETEAELSLASNVGCDLLQGFYFGKPSSVQDGWPAFFKRYPLINPKP
ncbi:GGDEF domain-containing response regulator [Marinagarivorans algicola]|uniref:two-component system response regulator n=1 Tax=Marinagarivorans algicola TaxID=1513270 RepID=UPI0006B5E94D|nr:GGDEF domain-containing response regulator [Marinagarivorans algicola]